MSLREPVSMEECVYFTNRTVSSGRVRAWVFRERCPKCQQGLMGKPRDAKTGKVKVRADVYKCSSCEYAAPVDTYEETLTVSIRYVCPSCGFKGESQVPFQWKKTQVFDEEEAKKRTVELIRFSCGKCRKDVNITKKMK